MKHHQKLHLHIGLRMFKTALAVTIALAIARLFQSYSPIFAGLGAVVAMARTLRESLDAAKTQFVGVILGGIVSMLLLVIDPTPSVLLIGGGVLVSLALCGIFKLYYAVSLTAIIVLSVCVSTGGDPPLVALGFRLIDTSIGLSVALAVNMLIKPYNNRHRVTNLLHKLADAVPGCLEQRFVYDLTPDLTPMITDLRALDVELDIFRRQHFRRPLNSLFGQKTPVIADDQLHAGIFLLHFSRHGLRKNADIGFCKIISDDGAPSSGAEMNAHKKTSCF